jgi:endoglucanase
MPRFWNAGVAKWLKEDWHVTLIRAAMAVEAGGYLQNPAAEKAKLEVVVRGCIDAGIYVIIDWHDDNADKHVTEAKAFFSEMAQKYGRFPNVLFETWNEPHQIDWASQIKPYHEQIVPVIRQYTDNIIILGTRTWSQEVDTAAQNPVSGTNLAYTVHFYAASMGADLRARVSAALDKGVAVFSTEWGTCEYTGNGALNFQETQAWLDFFEQHHISDANWAISDKAESCAALNPGASATGGWPESQLTQSGTWVRHSLRAYARAQGVAGEGEIGFLKRKYSSGKHARIMDLPRLVAAAVASLSAGLALVLFGMAALVASALVLGVVVVKRRGLVHDRDLPSPHGVISERRMAMLLRGADACTPTRQPLTREFRPSPRKKSMRRAAQLSGASPEGDVDACVQMDGGSATWDAQLSGASLEGDVDARVPMEGVSPTWEADVLACPAATGAGRLPLPALLPL